MYCPKPNSFGSSNMLVVYFPRRTFQADIWKASLNDFLTVQAKFYCLKRSKVYDK